MTATHHYKSNLRDIYFNLFEVLEIQKRTFEHEPYRHLDEATTREILARLDELCRTEIDASFVASDRVPLVLDAEGNVTLPEELKRSNAAYKESGFDKLDVPERLGGFGAPPSVSWAAFELVSGANPCVGYYAFGSVIARIIDRLGTESQKARYVKAMLERGWGGSMVLTEPDAGSDVGAARAKARPVAGDVWEIEGVKRFITNGDFDGVENIVHLVLARPEGAGPGTKGLSMFIVPKFWVNEDGSLGERNGAFVTNIEKKMGIKGSATCEMTFGERTPARGLLVGEVHRGIQQMFHVIEQARMGVGVKSVATLSTAYLHALAYTKERVQGPELPRATDKTAPRIAIIGHADVRRMLMLQKCHAEGMRALALFTASIQDQVEIAGGHVAAEAKSLDALNDLLLPLVKGYCSEKAYEMLTLSLQCLGGSGYVQDYPIEQYVRDQKIDTLYEGTTHIQALDLLLRKVGRDGGATLGVLLGRIGETLAKEEGGAALAAERQRLGRAVTELQAILAALMGKLGESLQHVGLQGNRVLAAVAETVIGWLLLRQAAVALGKRDAAAEPDRAFYDGKVAACRFYCQNVLPSLELTRKLVEQSSLELLSLPDDAF
ncbi:MAG: acyl-CoA dehydrogenase [Polyangiaceae bacterium]|nr:acyl-CoA dehydrogenase [Polyangiaceae bacterium]